MSAFALYPRWELPPRARRILSTYIVAMLEIGTTSACAENTGLVWGDGSPDGNYLRVRGEYSNATRKGSSGPELPPRARRIQIKIDVNKPLKGTTSACAENTGGTAAPARNRRNYLRVRGEYLSGDTRGFQWGELPPRARRIHPIDNKIILLRGTTSACAENTQPRGNNPIAQRNYLRVRGEYRWR